MIPTLLFCSFFLWGGAAALPTSLPVQQGGIYRGAHVLLVARSEQEAAVILPKMEEAYRMVRAFGLSLPPKIHARSHSTTQQFAEHSGGTPYHLAYTRGNVVHLQPLHLLVRRRELQTVLCHEIVHVALLEAALNGLPLWFNEGLAMSIAGEAGEKKEGFDTLTRLEETLATAESYPALQKAYQVSGALVARLIQQFGRDRVVALADAVAGGKSFPDEFRKLVGSGPDVWAQPQL